jgi:hypothetical protein
MPCPCVVVLGAVVYRARVLIHEVFMAEKLAERRCAHSADHAGLEVSRAESSPSGESRTASITPGTASTALEDGVLKILHFPARSTCARATGISCFPCQTATRNFLRLSAPPLPSQVKLILSPMQRAKPKTSARKTGRSPLLPFLF